MLEQELCKKPDAKTVLEVLQYLIQAGAGDKTVNQVLCHMRRLSFQGTFTAQTQTDIKKEEEVEVMEDEDWIENRDEFEQSL